MSATSIALNRFGLGARPDQPLPSDPRRWLLAQMDRFDPRPAAIAALPNRHVMFGQLADYIDRNKAFLANAAGNGAMQPRRMARGREQGQGLDVDPAAMMTAAGGDADAAGKDAEKQLRQFLRGTSRDNYVAQVGARTQAALGTETPFMERMVHFWANHFAVSADKLTVIGVAGLLEFEAIRPHVMGKFGDMLNAVERHPTMLLYLDQAQSIGPDSPIGALVASRGRRKVGLNENLAREIMELHTLGVRTGYSQADVTEFARAMTGWSVAGLTRGPLARFATGQPGDFVFVEAIHEPGPRQIMGKTYAEGGERQAQAVLNDLAAHPSTATHIATKLARHFTGDVPPPALVERLQQNFLQTGGDLPSLYRTLIASPECWAEVPGKFRTPWDWSVASMRVLALKEAPPQMVTGLMTQLGQAVWRPGSPAGYDDLNASWAGPDAIMRRVEAAERMASRAGAGVDARALAAKLYPGALSPATQTALANAESPSQALALLLVAPESMRR